MAVKSALVVIDAQNAIVKQKDFTKELSNISTLIKEFTKKNDEIIFVRHISDKKGSVFFHAKTDDIKLCFDTSLHKVFEKSKTSAFSSPEFCKYLKKNDIDRLIIVGFNVESCCMFTAVVAWHEGYDVVLIENACGTVNDEKVHNIPGLDVGDFVGTILEWSETVKTMTLDEFMKEYLNESPER